jgi:hypothetical protein
VEAALAGKTLWVCRQEMALITYGGNHTNHIMDHATAKGYVGIQAT